MSWISKLKNTLSPNRLDTDVAEELRDHLARRAESLESQGIPPAEAHRRAALAFGSVAAIREETRERKLWPAIESALQDIRYAAREMRRGPIFALTAVLSLGLAIGANTAIFSIVEAILLRPLPVPQPERLFTLATPEPEHPGMPISGDTNAFSYPAWEQLRDAAGGSGRVGLCDSPSRSEAQAAFSGAPYEEVSQQYVSADAFDILGVSPAVGRLFSPEEDRFPTPRKVIVLSYEFWRHRFGGDPAVIGQTFVVGGNGYAILGVARQGFTGIEPGKFVDLWIPITLTDPGIYTNAEFRAFHLFGRLAPGASREQLEARLQPAFHRRAHLSVHSGANGISAFRDNFIRPLWILFAVAACLLVIACANVASLLLARSSARAAEMALRLSLGARRTRLVRQLLTESLLIAVLASLLGYAFARVASPVLTSLVSKGSDPVRLDLTLDLRVLLFSASVCAFSTIFFGLLPALQVTSGRPKTGRLRLGRAFVALQVAFSFCLVAGGAAFVFSLYNLTSVATGFDSRGLTVLTITNDLGPQQRTRQLALMQEIRLRAGALPNVQGAATAWTTLFSGARRAQRILVPGRPLSDRPETFYRVSPGYFATLRTPLLRGRDLTVSDNDDEPVPTVVNRTFARTYFGSDTAALGREFQRDDKVRHQVVGIAADSTFTDLHKGPEPIAYMPMKPPRAFTLYVRSTLDAASVMKMIQRETAALGGQTRVRDVTTLDTLVGNTMLTEKLLASLGGVFALFGLTLAAIGLFGLLNYSVTRRTKEIGIRAALGATRLMLHGVVLRDLMGTVAVGLALGLAGAFALLQLTHSLMFGIQPADPLPIAAALIIFGVAAGLACSIPARRAAAIDPMVALRHE